MFREEQNTPTLLSDHMPFIVETDQGINLIGWNILKRMKFNDKFKFYNNGFNCENESIDFYHARLQHEATQLSITAKKSRSAFICLQECPEQPAESCSLFKSMLKEGELNHYANQTLDNGSCSLITLYDETIYELNDNMTNKIAALQLTEGLQKLILPLVFKNKSSQETILVINVHANFNKDVKQDVMTIYQYAESLGINNVVFLGDFNRDLAYKSDDYSKQDIASSLNDNQLLDNKLFVKALSGGSFCSSFSRTKLKDQLLETRDGAISTCPITTKSMLQTGIANTALSFTKALSPTLKVMPKNFLTTLEELNNQQLKLSPVVKG